MSRRGSGSGGDGAETEPTRPVSRCRPPLVTSLRRIGVFVGVAWAASFLLYAPGTAAGSTAVARLGFGEALLWWIVTGALVAAGCVGAHALLRVIARGERRVTRRGVLPLAVGDAFFTMLGGFVVAFLLSIGSDDSIVVLGWTFGIGVLFSFAALFPAYVAGWDASGGR